jgi:CPA1 family monovalent cation:H+ antiporter
MLEIFSIILILVLISKFIEDKTKVPFVLTLIILSYITNQYFDLAILKENFDEILYMMLPIILIPDLLGISRSELEENFNDIFYLAFIAVVVSIFIAVSVTYLFDIYSMPIEFLILLFAPLMATDVVSVSSIFSKFRLPKKLKLYSEGESLFNDITAMIIFFFIALPISQGNDLSIGNIHLAFFKVVLLSIFIGLLFGIMGYYLFKFFHDSFEKFLSIYVMASLSFLVSEHFHVSGIFSIVVSVLLFKYLFDKEGHYKKIDYNLLLKSLNSKSSSDSSFRAYKKEAYYLALFGNGVVFVAIANVINIELLLKYKYEILYLFILTTLIRYLVLLPITIKRKYPFSFNNIMTFSGMKGGLAIIMVVSLPDSFEYKEMFTALVLGVVILSIFSYTFSLMIYLKFFNSNEEYKNNINIANYNNIKNILQKESSTNAYNEIMFKDFVEKEIYRASRYNYQFSIIAFKCNNIEKIDSIIDTILRDSDYFGKVYDNYYAILLTHSDVNGALIFAHRLQESLGKVHISISEYATGDTLDMIYEKLYAAIKSKKSIDIEV